MLTVIIICKHGHYCLYTPVGTAADVEGPAGKQKQQQVLAEETQKKRTSQLCHDNIKYEYNITHIAHYTS